MKKMNFILIFVTILAFISCGERPIDMRVTSCLFDKTTYKLNEDIIFNCTGEIYNAQTDHGDLGIEIIFSKKIDGDADQKLNIEIIDSGNLNIEIDYYNDREDDPDIENPERSIIFYVELMKNSRLKDFKQKILFRPKESGSYIATVRVMAASPVNTVDGDMELFTIPFTVEAE